MSTRFILAAFISGLVGWALIFTLIGLGARALAQQSYVLVSGIAMHFDGKHHCNTVTKGLGVMRKFGDTLRAAAGVYDNSNCDTSVYAAAAALPWHHGDLHLGAMLGRVSGYAGGPWITAGGLLASLERRDWGASALFIPASGGVLWINGLIPIRDGGLWP